MSKCTSKEVPVQVISDTATCKNFGRYTLNYETLVTTNKKDCRVGRREVGKMAGMKLG